MEQLAKKVLEKLTLKRAGEPLEPGSTTEVPSFPEICESC